VTLFEKSDINQLLTEYTIAPQPPDATKQLDLFGF